MQHSFPSEHHYIRFAVSPPTTDALTLRKALQDALTQTFGITSAGLYTDILWSADDGAQFVVRVRKGSVLHSRYLDIKRIPRLRIYIPMSRDAAKFLSAAVAWSDQPRISLVKESPFLPSLISVDELV
ncbi:hypothetical protein Hypma_001052 [Hypsizygus marmoreus]|uniref:Uncharacterized protein n=1 Tax=Hypsizygus marmoreus TaxID=39966 RepID=A0A369J725_HYPMA|nr:hypothetical protein Hypma_001052 [Hypsizygus marmoreus]